MGSIFSNPVDLTPEELTRLKAETGFTDDNIKRLFTRFQHLDKDGKGYLDKDDLMAIPELHMNPVGERIICAFFPPKYNDSGEIDVVSSDRVNFYHFAKVFGVFRPVSSNQDKNVCNLKEHKVRFLFDLIDHKGNGKFSKDDLYDVLEMMVGVDVDNDQLDHIVERVIQEADEDNDGLISFEEFMKAVSDLDIETKMAFVGFK